MKRFDAFLTEQETEAHKKAIAMGLEYRGFGYWADKQTGKITHRSSGDDLTEVGGGLEAASGGPQEMGTGAAGSVADMATGAMMGEPQMGAVKPGEEQAPKDTNWEPGPDGSTDVGQDKDTVEGDVFVGKNNQAGWEAGADGSNITNWSFDQFQEAAIMEGSGMPAAQEAKLKNLTSDGHGMWFDSKGTPVARTLDGELEFLSPKERDQEQAKIVARNMRKPPGVEMSGDMDAREGGAFMQKVPAGKRTNMMHDYLRQQGLAPEVVDPKLNPMAAQAKVKAAQIRADAMKSAAQSKASGAMMGSALGAVGSIGAALLSDEKTKDCIAELKDGLSIIRELKPVSFYYNDKYSDEPWRMHYGFIAQEYGRTMPYHIYKDTKNDVLKINTNELIAVLVQSIQELEQRLEALEK